jgi:hypothetical protein
MLNNFGDIANDFTFKKYFKIKETSLHNPNEKLKLKLAPFLYKSL